MSEKDNERDAPRTAWEAEGSPIKRGKHPVSTGGKPADREGTASIKDVGETAKMGVEPEQAAPGRTRRPARKIGRRTAVSPAQAAAGHSRPTDEDGTHRVASYDAASGSEPAEFDPAADRRGELAVTALFTLSILGTIGFCVAFFTLDLHSDTYGRELNYALATGFAVSLLGIGMAAVVWAKQLMPHEKVIQERGTHYSHEEDELAAEDIFLQGTRESGFPQRKMLRRSMLGALALFPIPLVVAARDLGPLPRKRLRHTGWSKGVRLVAMETRQPIKLGDVPVGGLVTVMPEGYVSAEKQALSPTILIRIPPNELRLNHPNWAVDGHVAYSKICTHAGCPVGLYEDQSHHLFCPCHQSTFDAANGCKVVFGPAARPLPQLPIYADSEGYLRARRDYTVPVGPSFWERG